MMPERPSPTPLLLTLGLRIRFACASLAVAATWALVGGCACGYPSGRLIDPEATDAGDTGGDPFPPGDPGEGDLDHDSGSPPTSGTDGGVGDPDPPDDPGPPPPPAGCGDPYAVPSGSMAMCGPGFTGPLAPPPTISGPGFDSNCDSGAGYSVDVYESGSSATPALRIVGVYEATWDRGFQCHPAGEASVDVARPGANVLVLSSYEPVHWTVSLSGGATLDRVILNGFHPQSVTTPVPVPVDNYSGSCSFLSACATRWGWSGSCDTTALVSAVEALTGLSTTSFHGCYAMSELSLY